jgi:hypothetical protein
MSMLCSQPARQDKTRQDKTRQDSHAGVNNNRNNRNSKKRIIAELP